MRIGQTLRIVRMDGCMATVRNNPREGVMIGYVDRPDPSSGQSYRYVRIAMDYGGKIEERPAEPRLWSSSHDGVLEYQE